MDALLRISGRAAQDIGEPGPGIDVVELGGLDQGVHGCGPVAAGIGAGEGPVLASDRDAAHGPFGGVVGEAGAAVRQEQREGGPAAGF